MKRSILITTLFLGTAVATAAVAQPTQRMDPNMDHGATHGVVPGQTDRPIDATTTPHSMTPGGNPADPRHVQGQRGTTDAPTSALQPHAAPGVQRGDPGHIPQGGTTDHPTDARGGSPHTTTTGPRR